MIKDLEQSEFPDKMVVPNIGIVHDRIMLELFRVAQEAAGFAKPGSFTGLYGKRCLNV